MENERENCEERRSLINVSDKPTEFRMLLNNILTFFVLGGLGYIGYLLTSMDDNLANLNESMAVAIATASFQSQRIAHLERILEKHTDNQYLHGRHKN